MKRLLIVDGSNLLFQIFFGMPARIVNEQGRAIQGTLGFTGALLKIIRRVEPKRFGITPGQYADFKSLTGDAADHIKGADKIGPKTAAFLLGEFGTLENVLANAGNIKKPSVRQSVLRNAERLKVNYEFIKLGNTAPLPFMLQELAYRRAPVTTNEVLKGIGLK